MVLTRAQRAQTKGTPPESPLKTSVLKAPARRGRAKKTEEQPEEPTKAPATAKPTSARNPLSKSASTRTAATKASAAKASLSKSTSARISALKSSSSKPPATKKATAPSKDTNQAKPARKTAAGGEVGVGVPVEEVQNDIGEETAQSKGTMTEKARTNEQEDKATEPPKPEEHQAPVPSVVGQSPTKLPRPAPSPSQAVSLFKMSLLSPNKVLGSVRKQPVTGTLFAMPARAFAPSPIKPSMDIGFPVRATTAVRDFGASLGSPRRPNSSGSDQNGTPASAKRPAATYPGSITGTASPKRLKTAISMPSLSSPQRSQASSSDSPLSPVKSSIRSPEKRPGWSPKKVSWHQTPPPRPVSEVPHVPKAPGILDGLVFFLDINNLQGVNSNSLFAPLVEELGGESILDWTSNNMGITHVLFMNGETRTLEKVVASNGEVHCVSLGWLLDCQRENTRIPEDQPRYAIDLTHIPGHTPKPHSKTHPNTPLSSRTPTASHTPALPPPSWTLTTTPARTRSPLGTLSSSLLIKTPAYLATKATPAPPPSVGIGTIPEEDKENVSPVSENTPLVQKTCPPKQLNKSILAMSTGVAGTPFRKRLMGARRRSVDAIPKSGGRGLGSPLRRGFGN